MTYDDIKKVNSEIQTIDLKGKNYAMVPERVTAFRKLYPNGFINTEILENDGTTVLMQARAGYYENGCPITLGTGFAQEVRGKGLVNGTSHIENCETSAVGRALGFLGLGIDGGGICSAEELVNAITAQKQLEAEQRTPAKTSDAQRNPANVSESQRKSAQVSASLQVPSTSEKEKNRVIKILQQNAKFAYGENAEAKLNELCLAQNVTLETMTGAAYKAIEKQIIADIAANKKDGAA